ncbi:PspC domain-containing protein [Knoellia sp. 3-2P3]|uniref:ATP-binding protein n=1 Tax=unclassified Knoellia TaxID=2618719 RepID=UPI0023DBAED6|nr:ATP-binding protein [Knoellia sp. 3-2P3]MDF2093844.1 PspC domain-containing protein [Knoellia sp. 3-2P3]
MPTPYERPATALEAGAAEQRPPRRTLHRPVEGRVVAGVCAGLAEHLGAPVRLVRIVFVLLALPGGAGLAAYLFLWALTPQSVQGVVEGDDGRVPVDPARPSGPAVPVGEAASAVGAATDEQERSATRALLAGGVLLVAGLVAVAQSAGFNLRLGFLVPLLIVAVGAVIAWSQLDDAQRGRWLGSSEGPRRFSVARLVFGALLALTGLVIVATRGRSLSAIWDIALASLAVVAGFVLIAAPWGLRLWGDLRREQAERARATERADIAAHLHDSVLQTLALIQRRADDPAAVAQLARAQERELRSWLYAGQAGSDSTLASAVAGVAHEVEDVHGTPIELVATGDRPLDDGGTALVRAVREALLNAVRHGRPPVSVYVEIGPAGVEAFVRDHGDGFELDDVPEDRLGVRQSILGRMQRHGGSARVRRLEHGTEVCLTLPPLVTNGGPAEPVRTASPQPPAEASHATP